MDLEEAATRLNAMAGQFAALKFLEDIISTARSVDNIKNLAAERMKAADLANIAHEAAKADLFNFRIAADKEKNDLKDQIAGMKEDFRRQGIDLANDIEAKKMEMATQLRQLQDSHNNSAAAMAREISALANQRDETQKQCDTIEKNLAALRKKLAGLMGDSA